MAYLIIASAILLAGFAFLSWKFAPWAVALTIVALPTYLVRFKVGPVPLTLLEILILILFLAWLIKKIVSHHHSLFHLNEKTDFSGYKWLILIFLILATFAVFVSTQKIAALGAWKAYFIEPVLFFIVLINVIKTKKDWNLIIWALGVSALTVAIPAIVQKFTGWGIPNAFWQAEATRRVTSWYGYPNAVGLYLGPLAIWFGGMIGFVLGQKSDKKKCCDWKKWLKLFCFLVFLLPCLSAIYSAQSEGALIAFVFGMIIWGLVYPNKKLRLATLACLVLIGIFVGALSGPREYIANKFSLNDLSGQIRKAQWSETWKMLEDNRIITGAGLANYKTAVAPYHQEGIWIKNDDPNWLHNIQTDPAYRIKMWQPTEIYLYPHNIVLNFWSEIGLLGMLVFVFLLFRFFLNYLRLWSEDKQKLYAILMAVMAGIIVHGLVDVPYFKNDLSVFWWLTLGMSWVLLRLKWTKND